MGCLNSKPQTKGEYNKTHSVIIKSVIKKFMDKVFEGIESIPVESTLHPKKKLIKDKIENTGLEDPYEIIGKLGDLYY